MIEIREATKSQAAEIARLIMTAMTDDCCLYFCEEGYGLEDFFNMMTMLVEREDSQYSYKNTLVAIDGNKVVGISVSYDGGRLHELRRAFIEAAKEHIGKDHSGMDDETQAGELYLDSLAVLPDYRRQGIARKLLLATKERANCWRPKNEPIVWACRVLDFWLIKTILSARHYTPLPASNT